jgi:hypothetical protein
MEIVAGVGTDRRAGIDIGLGIGMDKGDGIDTVNGAGGAIGTIGSATKIGLGIPSSIAPGSGAGMGARIAVSGLDVSAVPELLKLSISRVLFRIRGGEVSSTSAILDGRWNAGGITCSGTNSPLQIFRSIVLADCTPVS